MSAARCAVGALVALVALLVTGVPAAPGGAAPPANDSWPTYHRDGGRTGAAPTGPNPSALRRLWRSPQLDGDIYAEPIVVGRTVVVATEHDTVAAFDAPTGRRRWSTHLAEPVPKGGEFCGDIDPSGITSTPVADASRGLVYVVTFATPARHDLVALDLKSGRVRFRRTVDPPGSNPHLQLQRAALALAGDRVLIGFGGLYGDCGDYHGYVVGVPADGTGPLSLFQVPAGRAGAVWAPSGPAVDRDGTVLIATGNATRAAAAGAQDLSNSVIRLSPSLTITDSFSPPNREQLSRGDIDLGSVGPALLPGGLVFQIGKEGVGYLLRGSALGGAGGQLFAAKVCGGGAYGGTATAGNHVYVACTDALVALTIDGTRFSVAWHRDGFRAGPPIVAGNVVWAVDLDGGSLRTFAAGDGRARGETAIGAVPHFVTPSAAGGRIFVAADRRIQAFGTKRTR